MCPLLPSRSPLLSSVPEGRRRVTPVPWERDGQARTRRTCPGGEWPPPRGSAGLSLPHTVGQGGLGCWPRWVTAGVEEEDAEAGWR